MMVRSYMHPSACCTPNRGEFWIADISFSGNNPVSTYIVKILDVNDDTVIFAPFVDGECLHYSSRQLPHFLLLKRVL